MQVLRKVFRGVVIPVVFLVGVLAVVACGAGGEGKGNSPLTLPKNPRPENTPTAVSAGPEIPPSLEIDYTQITGANPEEHAASLVALLNTKSEGFAKFRIQPERIEGEIPEKSGALYSYGLMVYGDLGLNEQEIEQYNNKVLILLKQVMSYTAKFVADANEPSAVQVQVSYPDGSQSGYSADANKVKMLKGAPIEGWLDYVEPVQLSVIRSEEIAQLYQAYQDMTMAFQIAVDEGFLTEDEMRVISEKLQAAQSQGGPPPQTEVPDNPE